MFESEAIRLKKNIGEKIKFYRKKLGLSQGELAELVKIETKSLSRIESGHNYPQCENLVAISTALKIAPWQLYFQDEQIQLEKMRDELTSAIQGDEKLVTSLYQYYKLKSL